MDNKMRIFGENLCGSNIATAMEECFKLKSSNITKGFFMGICKVISQMRYYQEEGTHIEFRLAIGIEKNEVVLPRLYRLQQKKIMENDATTAEDIAREVYSIIKKVIPCCKENNDIYVSLSLENNEVNSGIYFLELNMIDQIKDAFLDANYMIVECVKENLVQVIGKTERIYLKFDLEEQTIRNQGFLANNCVREATIVRYWKGVFEQAKRCCHGTMCLIVESDFVLEDMHEYFKNPLKKIEDITVIPNFFGENGSAESDHSLQIFYSMLNYDGITIIDTIGRVISYNNICDNSKRGDGTQGDSMNINCASGSRHIAYENMKNWDGTSLKLVGLYFQSQEGEILFYNYRTKKQLEYFDASVMNNCENKVIIENAKQKYLNSKKDSIPSNQMSSEEATNYQTYISYVNELSDTHIGIDNFYREYEAAEKLKKIFEHPEWKRIIDEQYTGDSRHAYTRKETLDAVFACIVGNTYGYAMAAQDVLKDILDAIPNAWISEYFREEYFLNTFLLQDIRSQKPYDRWTNTVKNLLKDRNEVYRACCEAMDKYSIADYLNYYWCMSNFEITPELLGDARL